MGGTQTAEIYWRLGCQSCAEVDSEAKGEEIAFISFRSPVHCYLKIEYIRFLRENVWKRPWTLLSGVLSLFQKVYNNVHNHINTSKMAITNVCANCVILARGVVGFFFFWHLTTPTWNFFNPRRSDNSSLELVWQWCSMSFFWVSSSSTWLRHFPFKSHIYYQIYQ